METSSFLEKEQPCWMQYCDINTVTETRKESLRLQQEKDDLKMSFLHSENTRRYLEYLSKDIQLWPSLKDTEAKLAAATNNRKAVKDEFELEKDKIKDVLQMVNAEYKNMQEKNKQLEEKKKTFENKKAMFEAKMKIRPEMAKEAIQKCNQAIEKLQQEMEKCNTVLATVQKSLSDLQAQLKSQTLNKGDKYSEQMLSRARDIRAFVESLVGVKVGSIERDQIHFIFTNSVSPTYKNGDDSTDELNLTLTVTMTTSGYNNLQIADVCTNIADLKIQDLVDVAIAKNDLPYLICNVKDRWTHHFPLLSEIDILKKYHAVDWIEEQSRLRVLVGNCGRIMFTLGVPQDYPTSRQITLLDSYGVDCPDDKELPGENSTLLEWVKFLEDKYGDLE